MKVLQNWQEILFLCLKYVSVLQLIFYFKGKNFCFNCTLPLRVVKISQIEDRDVAEYLRCENCNGMIPVANFTVHIKKFAGIKVFNRHVAVRMGRKLFPVYH